MKPLDNFILSTLIEDQSDIIIMRIACHDKINHIKVSNRIMVKDFIIGYQRGQYIISLCQETI